MLPRNASICSIVLKPWCLAARYPIPIQASTGSLTPSVQLKARIVVPRSDSAHIGKPVAVIYLGRALERVGQAPCLSLIRPIVGLQPMRLAKVRDRVIGPADAIEVLAELKVCRR